MTLVIWCARAFEIYLLLGIFFALPFVFRGVNRIDPVALAAGWGFRLILIPGAIALWPWLLRRWIAGTPPPRERNAHRSAALEIGR